MGQGLTGILLRFEGSLGPLLAATHALTAALAVWLLVVTVRIWGRASSERTRGRGDSLAAGGWTFFTALCLLALPTILRNLSAEFLGTTTSAMAYVEPQGSGTLRALLSTFCLLVGTWFVIHGMMVLRKVTIEGEGGNNSISRGVVLIGAGIVATNMLFVMQGMNNWLLQSDKLRAWLGG
jgi:hypothetical protein